MEQDQPVNPTIEFVMGELVDDNISWLASFPIQRVVAGTLLLFHGSPECDQNYFLETVTERGVVDRSAEDIREALSDHAAIWVACGHSHVPRIRRSGGGLTVFNPGSVGLRAYSDDCPYVHRMESGTPHAKYATLNLVSPEPAVELRRVPYAWGNAARRAGELGREDWAVAIRTGRPM